MEMESFRDILQRHQTSFCQVMPFDRESDRLVLLDLTAANPGLTDSLLANERAFSSYINRTISQAGARYGIGGYNEHRTVYSMSPVFDGEGSNDEPRRLHLGTDIWGPAGTPVMAPLEARVHSFAFNGRMGDYGGTIILQHQLDNLRFYTLYGHLSQSSLQPLREGDLISPGKVFAWLGVFAENGGWPPHLHFQIIWDLGNREGDYPGVCRFSEREKWLANSPDPDLILQWNRYIK